MFQVKYYNFGQIFTLEMNREQAIKELRDFGYPIKNPKLISNKSLAEMIQEIYH